MNYYHISYSWLNLFPNKDMNGNLEPFESYYNRKKKCLSHIPEEVLIQWFHPLHNDSISLRNYAWISYEKEDIQFNLEEWSNEQIQRLNIISDGIDYYESLSSHNSFENLKKIVPFRNDDLNYWLKYGTWSVSPIILDCNSFPQKPNGVEIKGNYQLIEGHTRTGILNSFIKIKMNEGFTTLKETHKVWVMKNNSK